MSLDLFEQIKNSVFDLQASEYNTFTRPLKELALLLKHTDLEQANKQLLHGVDLEAFLSAQKTRGEWLAVIASNGQWRKKHR